MRSTPPPLTAEPRADRLSHFPVPVPFPFPGFVPLWHLVAVVLRVSFDLLLFDVCINLQFDFVSSLVLPCDLTHVILVSLHHCLHLRKALIAW